MNRRWVSFLGVPAVVTLVLLITADTASAQLRGRLRSRFGYYDRGTQYPVAMPMTTTDTTMTSVSYTEAPMYQARPARRFLRRGGEPMYYSTPSGPGYYSTPMTTTAPGTAQRSFYPQETTATTPTTALITVRVPTGAEILFDGQKTTQTGITRQFISPELERGATYAYEIEAKWTENGREVAQKRTVNVLPGQGQVVDFMATSPGTSPVPTGRRPLRR
jgi:uncharacterized protein (TIGR03000 family)